jgi:hypothetical protein
MKVPYADRWQKETDKLRKIAVDCDLTETLKWGLLVHSIVPPSFTMVDVTEIIEPASLSRRRTWRSRPRAI